MTLERLKQAFCLHVARVDIIKQDISKLVTALSILVCCCCPVDVPGLLSLALDR